MIRVVLLGAAGRMGRAVVLAAAGERDLAIRALVDRAENRGAISGVWHETLAAVLEPGDVVVEFSAPAACRDAAERCAERGAALVSGTTGLGPDDEAALTAAAGRVAVLRATNFSLGVAVLRRALAAAVQAAPAAWDVEIVERHHRAKVDAPSGTALTLAADVASLRGWAGDSVRAGRTGRTGPRPAREIGVASVRGGSWTGDHEVLLAGEGEWLELRHVASDRAAFARGALAAARFVAGARPGLYSLDDCLTAPRRV
jgi:4-hydroxy-tetrahydrodipicolinate reductase